MKTNQPIGDKLLFNIGFSAETAKELWQRI